MKTKLFVFTLALFSTLNLQFSTLFAQGTAFTYQGRFTDNGAPANGAIEFQFTLWNALSGGTQVATATPASIVINVTNGLFTAPIDFGTAAFDGADRWVQVDARTTLGPFTTLTPRQKVTATPYAIRAANFTGTIGSGQLAGAYTSPVTINNAANVFNGSFSGDGGGLTNLTLGGLSASSFWKLGGNAGTTAGVNFLGTTDNQPLELKANGQRALRLEPVLTITNSGPGYTVIYSNAPNVIGGSSINAADAGVLGSFIGGGGMGGYYVDQGAGYVFYGPFPNRVSAKFANIAGGYGNTIQMNADNSAIGGGALNIIQTNATGATIGGGNQNINSGAYATIGGGSANTIQTNANFTTIGGGLNNTVQTTAGTSTIGGGQANNIQFGASDSGIAFGSFNTIQTNAADCTISGGDVNTIGTNAEASTIGGGAGNTIGPNARRATVPGGFLNTAAGSYSFAAGLQAKALHQGAFVWADSQNADFSSAASDQFLIRASGGVGINKNNPATALDINGSETISGTLNFGTATRQMVNFYGTGFGMGVQTATLYARSNTRFSWFINGIHSDAENDPGAGGTRAMTLTAGGLTVNGTFVSASDRHIKEKFEPLNSREVFDKVVSLPLSKWSYKQDSATRHLGPMAQDFYAAFGVGPDDKHIATVDADGVALAAIQGLNEKLNDKLKEKDSEIDLLKQRLEKLERIVEQQTTSR
ncbi:MAG: tail fiber domain-containing protein [Verrucomicrobiota bacterium]|nr:tail fiber domain-containing protein [Verrucomicrobiota bacterium]